MVLPAPPSTSLPHHHPTTTPHSPIPALTLEESTLLRAFSTVTFHSCIQWEWDSQETSFGATLDILAPSQEDIPKNLSPYTQKHAFLICTPDTATLLHATPFIYHS